MSGTIDHYFVTRPATPMQRPHRDAPPGRPYVRWRIRWYDPRDPLVNGKRKLRSKGGFATRKEAERALTRECARIDEGTYVSPSKLTVGDWLAQYLESRRPIGATKTRGKLSPVTHEHYERHVRAWVLPYPIAALPLADLRPHDLEAFYDELTANGKRSGGGLSDKSILNVHNMLSGAMKAAVLRGLIAKNPLPDVQHKPKAEHPELTWWGEEEMAAFLRHVRDDRYYAAWVLFATTGMRRSEVAGLSWEDVDLDLDHGRGALKVKQVLVPVRSQPELKGYPKTDSSARKLALNPSIVAALAARRSAGLQERLAAGPAYVTAPTDRNGTVARDLVFTWPDGSIVNPKRWSVWFKKHVAAAGLPMIRLHDVRHSYASIALSEAPSYDHVVTLSKRLGHSSVKVTLDRYAHVLPSVEQDIVDGVTARLLGEPA